MLSCMDWSARDYLTWRHNQTHSNSRQWFWSCRITRNESWTEFNMIGRRLTSDDKEGQQQSWALICRQSCDPTVGCKPAPWPSWDWWPIRMAQMPMFLYPMRTFLLETSNMEFTAETFPLNPRPPLLGRRIQVVGHAGAGKVRSVHTPEISTLIPLPQSVFSEKLAAAIQVSVLKKICHYHSWALNIPSLGTCGTFGPNLLE